MSQQFSTAAKQYLCRFYEILDEMIKGMEGAELTDSLSHNFIVQMIPHHIAAIEMSRNLLQYTDWAPLSAIARNIIKEQTESISRMRAALDRCSVCKNTPDELCLYKRRFRQITEEMFCKMGNAEASNNINADFMREMIPHHEGAISMSENALRYPICPELTPILNAIIRSQKKGVCKMEQLLRRV